MRTRVATLCMAVMLLSAESIRAVKVYKVRSEGLADVKVYETNSEGLADCIIYVTNSEGLANGNAKWYYVNSEGLADVKIFFTQSEGLADKKIYFTKSEGLAKCDVDWEGYKKTSARWLSVTCSANDSSSATMIRDLLLPGCRSLQTRKDDPDDQNAGSSARLNDRYPHDVGSRFHARSYAR